MTFADIQRRTWRENILFSALVELTYRCNLDCFFCYNDTALQGVPLSMTEYLRLFEGLRDLGTLNLTLTGGEPLAHPGFFTLGGAARDLGFVVRVKSNGHALRGDLARRLKEEVDPFIVEISLHGACPETHDRQTRVPGSFERLMANLAEAHAQGLRIKLNSVLTAWNEHEIEATFALADQLGLPIHFYPQVTRRDDGDTSSQQVAASRDGIARLLEIQRRRSSVVDEHREAGPDEPGCAGEGNPSVTEKHCGAGSSTVTVDPYGNVYPCVEWRRRIGNLHEKPIGALWNEPGELNEIRRLTVEVKQSIGRLGPEGFGFCPGSAEQETGAPTRLYPLSQTLLELRQQRPGG